MATKETLHQVTQIYRAGENKYGCTDLDQVCSEIGNRFDFERVSDLVHAARRISRPDHLFPGALSTVQQLLARGDRVVIWTQGHPRNQMFKVAGSGINRVKHEGPDKSHFSLRAEMDKVTAIDQPIMDLRTKGVEKVVIVDDKSDNVKNVKARVAQLQKEGKIDPKLDISVIWARYGVYKDKAPKGMTLDDFLKEVETIEDISELKKYKAPTGKTGWLLDFDNTLFQTAVYNNEMYAQTAHQVDGLDQILPAQIGVHAGLSGKIIGAKAMKHGGMSGSNITLVDTGERTVVVKHHHSNPDRVTGDIKGYEFLKNTPVGEKMPLIESSDLTKGYLVLPHIEGKTLREQVLTGGIDQHSALGVFAQLLDLKKVWWSQQEKKPFEPSFKSMQRAEWLETQQLIPEAVQKIAEQMGIGYDNIWSLPLQIGGRRFPSLETMVQQVQTLLQKMPDYLVGVHGDATGSNLIIGNDNKSWSLIDAEWAGLGDPAESFVRMAKHRSTTTATNIVIRNIQPTDNTLEIDLETSFNSVAHYLHDYVTRRAAEFATALNDPDFLVRFNTYFAGSYLRELALINKRGKVEDGIVAMTLAADALTKPAAVRRELAA
jgi:hypothetical protein